MMTWNRLNPFWEPRTRPPVCTTISHSTNSTIDCNLTNDSDPNIPSKLVPRNYHHQQPLPVLEVELQNPSSHSQIVRTEVVHKTFNTLPVSSPSSITKSPVIFPRRIPPTTKLSVNGDQIKTNKMESPHHHQQNFRKSLSRPNQREKSEYQRTRSPNSVGSIYSDVGSFDGYGSSSTPMTSVIDWRQDRTKSGSSPLSGSTTLASTSPIQRRWPSSLISPGRDLMVDGEAIEEMNCDTRRLDSEQRPDVIPNGTRRKTKMSVMDRPRPIGRAQNSTFSAPRAESDRLVQTVLKSSKSFDRGRRYWLAAPEHVSAITPPVPALPSAYVSRAELVRIKRQSSMINLPSSSSMNYSSHSSPLPPPPPHQQFRTHHVPNQASSHNELPALETLKKGGFQLFEDQSPSLALRDPSVYDVPTIDSSVPRRKILFPQSLRSKLKPRRGPNYA